MKRVLIELNKPPYSGDSTKESLDIALAMAAFDHQVSLLLVDQGVFNIIDDQSPKSFGIKEFTRLFNGLDLYDIEHIYVPQTTIDKWHLSKDQLFLDVEIIDSEKLSSIYSSSELTLSF